eukprot:PITA_33826
MVDKVTELLHEYQDLFPTKFIDLEGIIGDLGVMKIMLKPDAKPGGQETYAFTDGFSGYHQIKIVPEDRRKTNFVTKWGCFQYTIILFRLKNALVIFSHVVVEAFKEYIHKFLEFYFDDWTVFGLVKLHVPSLCLMLDTCRRYQIVLNLKKCLFFVPFGNLLGNVVCRQGLMVDPMKSMVILDLEAPRSVKQLCTTLGHTG